MRKRKHWLYAMTFLGGCLLLTPGSGSVLAGEQFSYQLNDNTAEAKETPVSSSAAANTALSEMHLIFDVTFPMTAEGETEANPEMRIETSLDVFGEDGWWEGSVYLNDTLSYCYLVDASTGKVIKLSDQVTAQKLVDIDMYEKQFSRWDLMELTSEDSWLEELKKYKDGTLFSTQETIDSECSQGIFIDVFPYDKLERDRRERTRRLKNARFWQSLSYLYHSPSVSVLPDGIKGKVFAFFFMLIHRGSRLLFNRDALQQHFNKSVVHGASSEYSGKTYVGVLASGDPWVFQCEDLLPVRTGAFCGKTYPIPRKAEKYLSQVYGTWAELPPVEKRKTHCPQYVRFSDGSDWSSFQIGLRTSHR